MVAHGLLLALLVLGMLAYAACQWAMLVAMDRLGSAHMVGQFALGLAVGHWMGAPEPAHSVVLALSTACRHPAIALAIATVNFPDQRFGGTILLYLLVSAAVGFPYVAWQRRRLVAAPSV